MKGQPPRSLPDLTQDISQRKVLYQNMSPHVRIRLKAQEIVTQCGTAVNEYGVLNLAAAEERGLDLLLKAYEQRVCDLHIDAPTCKPPTRTCCLLLAPALTAQQWSASTSSWLVLASRECTS